MKVKGVDENLAKKPVEEPAVIDPPEPLCSGPGPFRPNAAALVLRRAAGGSLEILLGERHDMPGAWQWPQGGLDPGEDPATGLLRELTEETGVRRPEILLRFPFLLRYRFPVRLSKKFSPNQGQIQHYFIVSLKPDDQPDLAAAEDDEFSQLRWFPLKNAAENAIWFKKPVYERAVQYATAQAEELFARFNEQ